MLKNSLLTMVLSGCLFTAASLAVAEEGGATDPQSTPATQPQEYGGRRHYSMDPVKRTEELTKRLNLTPDQQTKVQGILQTQQSSMQNLRQDASLSQEDRRSKMMDIRNTANTQIRGVLTEDQQQKWNKMQSSHRQMGWGKQGGQDSSANPQ